jgi:hypothetical protein
MGIVIVTRNQYIIADKIHHVLLDEHKEYHDVRNPKGRMVGVTQRYFNITIIYTPEATTNGRNDKAECSIKILAKVDAYKVYRDLIQQIREQSPDQLFLDKVLENLLTPDDLMKIEQEQINDDDDWSLDVSEAKSDRSAKKARKPRKAKRANKKVLRKSR